MKVSKLRGAGMSHKANVIIRKGAAHWDARVFVPSVGEYVTFDFSKMTGRQRSDWHREFMNAFRASLKTEERQAA